MPEQSVDQSDHGIPGSCHAEDRNTHTPHASQPDDGIGGVVIVARKADRICLIRHHRPVTDEALVELPRGLIGDGEDAEDAAKSSFTGETGHVLYQTRVLDTHYGNANTCPGEATVVYGVSSTAPIHRPDGDIAGIGWFSTSSIRRMIADGEIRDGHTLAALAHYLAR